MRFAKYEGLGNHFVLLEAGGGEAAEWANWAVRLCARGTGVGADGLLVALPPVTSGALGRMAMYNPDGTEDMCGNGARCVALHLAVREGALGEPLVLDTLAGPLAGRVECDGTVELHVGTPSFEPAALPALFATPPGVPVHLEAAGMAIEAYLASFATPHCVVFSRAPADPTFARVSAAIERHERFPERTSVMWADVRDRNRVRVRIWERAVGETWACGTGAASVATTGIHAGLLESPVDVEMPGGVLRIAWGGAGTAAVQRGPARCVFVGEVAEAIGVGRM